MLIYAYGNFSKAVIEFELYKVFHMHKRGSCTNSMIYYLATVLSVIINYLRINPLGAFVCVFDAAVEVDWYSVLGAGFLPGVAVSQPIVWLLDLINKRYPSTSLYHYY